MKFPKGNIGTPMKVFRIKTQKLSKKGRLRRNSHQKRLKREDEMYETIQLPNGDFEKKLKSEYRTVKKAPPKEK